ncbi:helix-turn-helix domain-containing protein [Haloglomus halophilum]|uniref:helix-turn-helix domain-containing protein n=1 Tax=Haloglomus halophilum TaxID=2962672 RepID=UPI0020C9A150|nr:helix-turn-helix domain-containing protein [Haloglomus halophilum]
MPDAMTELLQQEMECESLLDCFHGLSELDREVFRLLVEADEPQTVDELAAAVDRERTTAYRSVKRLREADLVEREQVNQDGGSYYHVFSPRDADEIADAMQRTLNDFYAKMGQLVGEFREKYAEAEAGGTDDGPEEPLTAE